MAKSKNDPKNSLPTVTIKVKRPAAKPARIDSIPVGGVKRSVKDISNAVKTLNASNSAKGFVKGVNSTNPVSSSRTLSPKSSTSDLVNRMIDSKNKKRK